MLTVPLSQHLGKPAVPVVREGQEVIRGQTIAEADGFMSVFEGAFILSKSLNEADITVKQLRHYKTYIELIFRQDD